MSTSPTHAAVTELPADALAASQAHCAAVTRRQARNFYYGMMLTPQPRRAAMYALYAWMRAVDDLADEPGDFERKKQALSAFRRQTHDVAADPAAAAADGDDPFAAIWPAVAATLRDYQIPLRYFDAMIEGQVLDQTRTRYASFDELYDYCYKVAGVVGLICIHVWGFDGGAATQTLAAQRGAALQLTNILRDLVEDAQRDRVYLPADELARFGFDAESLKQFLLQSHPNGHPAGDFDGLMKFQIERAAGLYEASAPLESYLTAACRPTCWAMMKIYEGLLRKIAAEPRRVLRQRVSLTTVEKSLIALRATWQRGWL